MKTDRLRRFFPDWLQVASIYAVSRILAGLMGVRFDIEPLSSSFQLIDPYFLRTELLESVWYLHSQPPLFNLIVGAVLKASAVKASMIFAGGYFALGLVLHLSLYRLLITLGLHGREAIAAVALLAFSPAAICHANVLSYTWPVATFLTMAALFFHRAVSRGSFSDVLVFFTLGATVAVMRSLYHLAWIVVSAGILLWFLRGKRRTALIAGALPVLLVLGLYLKNYILFDSFGSSSWIGMNLAKLITINLPREELDRLRLKGVLSPLATRDLPFRPFKKLPSDYVQAVKIKRLEVPVLAYRVKTTGFTNFNHEAFLAISRDYLRDAEKLILIHPAIYLKSVMKAWLISLIPPAGEEYRRGPGRGMVFLNRLYERFFYGVPISYLPAASENRYLNYPAFERWTVLLGHAGWLWAALLAAAVGRTLFAVSSKRAMPAADRAALLFISFTILYALVVGNALEIGENNRFRMEVEPLSFTLICLLVFGAARRFLAAVGNLLSARREGKAGTRPA